MNDRKALGQLLTALLIGLTGVVGTLLLLSQGASAQPVHNPTSLSISKSQSADRVQVGAQLVYTLAYTNTGDADATDIVITDTLDPHVIYVTAAPTATGGLPATPYWAAGPLSQSVSGAIVLTVTVTGPLPNGTVLTNTAVIDSAETATESTEITATVVAPALELVKSDDPDPVTSGAPLTYTLAYSNTGDVDATAVVITDALDSQVTFIGASPPPTGGEDNTRYWDVGTVAPADGGRILISTTVQSGLGEGTILTNWAAIDSQQTASLPVTETTAVSHGAAVSATLTPASATIAAGQSVSYTLVATDSFGTSWDASAEGSYAISPGAGGTWTGNVYTAEVVGLWTVTGTVDAVLARAKLTVTHASAERASLAPPAAAVTAGQSIAYTLVATDAFGNSWDATASGAYAITPGAGGTWTGNVYTAEVAGLWIVTGTVNAVPATAELTVTHASAGGVSLAPPTATVTTGQSIAYTLTALDTYGNPWDVTASGTYAISPGAGGTWTANVYTAGSRGDWTVEATYTETHVMTDIASLTVLAPVLELGKRGDPGSVEAGAYLTYTLSYSNTGDATATNVVITDVLDSNVAFVSASPTPDAEIGNTLSWNMDDLTPAAAGQIALRVAVTRPLTNGAQLANIAWLDAAETAPVSTTLWTTVTSRPTLTITKVDSTDPITEGLGLFYTIMITNSGNENATAVTVVEDYDPNISIVSTDPPADPGSDHRLWTFDMLPTDSYQEITVYGQVTSPIPVGTVLVNQVTLDSDQTAPITATETTSVTSVSDLTLYMVDAPDPVDAGEDLLYFITYVNTGEPPAYNVVITETYDSRVRFVQASPWPSVGNNVWRIGNLSQYEGGSILIRVRVDSPLPNETLLTNLATIDSFGTLPKTYTETTTVSSTTNLAFSVADHPDPVEPGDRLTYTLRYANAGNADATDVVVSATLDSHVSFAGAAPGQSGGSDDAWVWDIGDIAGEGGQGEILIFTDVTLPLTNGIALDFEAQLGYAEGAPLTVTAQTTVSSTPTLSLDKGNGVYTVNHGDRLTYTLTYANSGKENAYDVVITDTLPNYVRYLGSSTAHCQPMLPPPETPAEVVCHIPAITQTVGQARVFVQVEDPLPAEADFLTNTATMAHPSLAVPMEAVDVDPIRTKPDLAIMGTRHMPSLFSPRQLMTYTLTYGNVGQHMHAADVIITTELPTGTTYVDNGYWYSSDGTTYIHEAGYLPAGSVNHAVTFTVAYGDGPEIAAPQYNTPFTIAANRGTGPDAYADDNTADVFIGVPDLVVADWSVEPWEPQPDVPVTITIVLENQGTGMAWNPESCSGDPWNPICAGWFVDVFFSPVGSYPYVRDGDVFTEVLVALEPHSQRVVTITHDGFSQQEIVGIHGFYVKVDNQYRGRGQLQYGLVPEYDEMNNLGEPFEFRSFIYLPVVERGK